jgi:GT2 family glycosyltransferase
MRFTGSVVIVNFNSGEHLAECLKSVAAHAPEARVVVIDNASSDGSERVAEARPDRVALHRNQTNLGFAHGVNQGLALVSGDLVLVLNPDCCLLPGAVELLAAELAKHPDCAIVGPQILNDDGSVQGSARGDPTLLTGLFGRSTLLTRLFPDSPLARRNVRTDAIPVAGADGLEVDWVSGACMLARSEALKGVGGFDERYFLYWEDADVCRRLRHHGYSIRFVPAAHVVHTGGRSSRSAQTLATRAFHRSAYTYYARHVARTRLARALAWLLLTLRCQWKLLGSYVARRLSLL